MNQQANNQITVRGQGLNHSITDAINLVEAIQKIQADRTEMPELIASYNSEMIKRCGDEVKSSVKNAYLVHDWEKLMESPLMKVGIKKTS
jgi:2-polyprenyl-6-methoxyphenol hydroxylase-like FAD-dependent oxidoreductase